MTSAEGGPAPETVITAVWRSESVRLIAALVRITRDFHWQRTWRRTHWLQPSSSGRATGSRSRRAHGFWRWPSVAPLITSASPRPSDTG